MQEREIYEKLNEIFLDIFDDESIELKSETSAADIEDWDSLAQISIIVAVQDEFGIKLNVAEATNLHDVGEMVTLIQSKL